VALLALALIAAPSASAGPEVNLVDATEWADAIAAGAVAAVSAAGWAALPQSFREELGGTGGDFLDGYYEPYVQPYGGPFLYEDVNAGETYDLEGPGLVMAWGDAPQAGESYTAGWQYDYLVDPDITNAVVNVVLFAPQFGLTGGQVNSVGFAMQSPGAAPGAPLSRCWTWNCGPGGLPWNTPVTITIPVMPLGAGSIADAATILPATGYADNGFDPTKAQWFAGYENATLAGSITVTGPGGGTPSGAWNYWRNLTVTPGSSGPGTVIPEPTAVGLVGFAMFALWRRRG
jgi:MYXO-CTERM domain-containing protein